jgi:precorrin-6A/cobalt-precorrin-6A reductase
MRPERILILGGTGLARQAAQALETRGFDVTSSLAGVTQHPLLPIGKLRIGGFGGVEGLQNYLVAEKIDLVIDATHPFAAQISANAFAATSSLVRLVPRAWDAQAQDKWIGCSTILEAVSLLPLHVRVAATVGRKAIASFFARGDLSGFARMIEAPPVAVPAVWTLLQERPPFSLGQEIALFEKFRIQYIVSKNAGGMRAAKLDAAAFLRIPVIMIDRPFKPLVPTFHTIEDLLGSLGGSD